MNALLSGIEMLTLGTGRQVEKAVYIKQCDQGFQLPPPRPFCQYLGQVTDNQYAIKTRRSGLKRHICVANLAA